MSNIKEKMYRLTLSEQQLIEVKNALEMRFRLDLLQDDMLTEILSTMNNPDFSHDNPRHEEIFHDYINRRDHIHAIIVALFEIACPWSTRLSGNRKRDIHSLRVEDIWQVLRHQLWLDNENKQQWSVDSREALQCSDLELPKIERIDE